MTTRTSLCLGVLALLRLLYDMEGMSGATDYRYAIAAAIWAFEGAFAMFNVTLMVVTRFAS